MTKNSNFRPVDDEARGIAQSLLSEARFGALGVMLEGAPFVSRIALSADKEIIALVSTLAQHTPAMKANPRCSLMIGEPGAKGDPLTHPRLTIQAQAQVIGRDEDLRNSWLKTHPKAKLYIDFGDFGFIRFQVHSVFLNGGFGYACQMSALDLGLD